MKQARDLLLINVHSHIKHCSFKRSNLFSSCIYNTADFTSNMQTLTQAHQPQAHASFHERSGVEKKKANGKQKRKAQAVWQRVLKKKCYSTGKTLRRPRRSRCWCRSPPSLRPPAPLSAASSYPPPSKCANADAPACPCGAQSAPAIARGHA